jgi:hypothetical protein
MPYPLLYEVNTRCWLREFAAVSGRPITLADVPESEFLNWQRLGFTHIWLMGVWTGGPRARAQALNSAGLRRAYSEALPGWTEEDVGGSPYSVAGYRVALSLGGEAGLAQFRQRLHSFDLKLVLDFVPNHIGLDHPWVKERPELLVQAPSLEPGTFPEDTVAGRKFLAHGKDPNWPAWTDTVQLDYRRVQTRVAMTALLQEIAGLCDGVRCDMAMLLLNDVFCSTWKQFPSGEPGPRTEFWAEAIATTRRGRPEFLFLAEVYWGLEPRLQSLGFDYTYDKVLYDLLASRDAGAVQRHLLATTAHGLVASAHFLENHDEPRIASLLPMPEHRAAALLILGLPGMRFLHEGQLCGWRRRLPVQLARRGLEPEDSGIRTMYKRLLEGLHASSIGQGRAVMLVPRQAWSENPTAQNFILVQWRAAREDFDLLAINLAPHPGQCYVPLELNSGPVAAWTITDRLGSERFVRRSDDLGARGLYLDLPAHAGQIFHFEPVNEPG